MGVSIYNTTQRDTILTQAMQHRGAYLQAPYQDGAYETGDVVVDSGFVMSANKDTTDRPAPQPDGPIESPLELWTPSDQLFTGVVHGGHVYELLQAGWLTQIRCWVPEVTGNTNYRIIMADITNPDFPVYTSIPEPILREDEWIVVRAGTDLLGVGTRLLIYLDSLNSSGSTDFNDGWYYQGTNNTDISPGATSWNVNQQQTLLRIEKQSLGADYTIQLAGVDAGTSIQMVSAVTPVNYRYYLATGPSVDRGTWYDIPVVLDATSGGITTGVITDCQFSIPTPLPTRYSRQVGGLTITPEWANITGHLELNGVPSVGEDLNAFGIDIQFQPAIASPDWYPVSMNG